MQTVFPKHRLTFDVRLSWLISFGLVGLHLIVDAVNGDVVPFVSSDETVVVDIVDVVVN